MLKVSLNKLTKSPLIKEILIVFVLLLIGTVVFAQEGLNSRNLNENDLLIFYADPDNQDLTNAWEYIAQAGLSQAAFWEEEEYNNELLDRLLDWSGTKLKEMLPLPDIFEFLQTIDEANLEHLFETDSEGNIIYDDKGDPELKTDTDLDTDKAAWDVLLLGKIEEIIVLWEQQANVVYEELLSKFSDNIKTAAESKLTVSFNEYKNGAEREFANIFRQAENSFLFKRLKDSFSLRKKTEDMTAGEIAGELIEETKDELETAKDELVNYIIEINNNPSGTMNVSLEDWEESFRTEFEKGLLKWQNAESRFMQEYIRWETTAQENMLEAEQAWDEAFLEFRAARENWGQEILILIQDGREQWADMQIDYGAESDRVMADLYAKINSESDKVQREVSSLVSMYGQSMNVVELARDNAEYLRGEITRLEEKIASYDDQIASAQVEKAESANQLYKYSRYFTGHINYIPFVSNRDDNILYEILKNNGYYLLSNYNNEENTHNYYFFKPRTGRLTAEKSLEFRNQALEQVYSILHENMDSVEVSIDKILGIYNKRIEAYEDIFRLQQELNYWASEPAAERIEENARADLQAIAVLEGELRNYTTMGSFYGVNVENAGAKTVDRNNDGIPDRDNFNNIIRAQYYQYTFKEYIIPVSFLGYYRPYNGHSLPEGRDGIDVRVDIKHADKLYTNKNNPELFDSRRAEVPDAVIFSEQYVKINRAISDRDSIIASRRSPEGALVMYTRIANDARNRLFELASGMDAKWGEDFSDSYENELLRLEAQLERLDEQVQISRAVLLYAVDASSNRDTDAETEQNYNEALQAFQAAEVEYLAAIDDLEEFGDAISDIEQLMIDKKEELQTAQDELDVAEDTYDTVYEIYSKDNSAVLDFMLDDFNAYLDNYYKAREDYYGDYSSYWEGYLRTEQYNSAMKMRDNYLDGDYESGIKSLSEIEEDVVNVSNLNINWEDENIASVEMLIAFFEIEVIGISNAQYFNQFISAYGEAVNEETEPDARSLAQRRAEYFLDKIKQYYENIQFRYENIISMLDENTDVENLLSPELVIIDFELSEIDYFIAKVEFQLNVVNEENLDDDTLYEALALLDDFGIIITPDITGSLNAILLKLETLKQIKLDTLNYELGMNPEEPETEEELVEETEVETVFEPTDELIAFLDGSSIFFYNGFDYTDIFLTEEMSEIDRRIELNAVYNNYAKLSPAFFDYYREKDVLELKKALGYSSNEPDPELEPEIDSGEISEYFTHITGIADRESIEDFYEELYTLPDLPLYIEEIIDRYVYLQSESVGFELEDLSAQITEISNNYTENNELFDLITEGGLSQLETAGVLYANNIEGSYEYLRDIISSYIEFQIDLVADEQRTGIITDFISEALAIAGIEEELFSETEITDYLISFDFSGVDDYTDVYTKLLDGDLSEYVDVNYSDIENPYERAVIEAGIVFAGIGLSDEIIRQQINQLYLAGFINKLGDESDAYETELYVLGKLDNIRSLKYELSVSFENRDEELITINEKRAFKTLLSNALKVYDNDIWDENDNYFYDEAVSRRRMVYTAEDSAYYTIEEMADVKEQIAKWEADALVFYNTEVIPARAEMDEKQATFNTRNEEYTEILDRFQIATTDYNGQKLVLDTSYETFKTMRHRLQVAAEIRDYALSGYSLVELNPEGILAERLVEYNRVLGIYDTIAAVYGDGEESDFSTRMDAGYITLKEEEQDLTEKFYWVNMLEEALNKAVSDKQREIGVTLNNLTEQANDMFSFSRTFKELDENGNTILDDDIARFTTIPDEEFNFEFDLDLFKRGIGGLTDFGADNFNFEDYITGSTKEEYTADVGIWLAQMSGNPDTQGLLRDFAYAYYYEEQELNDDNDTSNNVNIGIFGNQFFLKMIEKTGEVRIFNNSMTANYEAIWGDDPNRPAAPLTANYNYNERKYLEEYYMPTVGKDAHNRLTANANTKKLYEFFKVMRINGQISFDDSFIGKDLSNSVIEMSRSRAKDKIRSLRNRAIACGFFNFFRMFRYLREKRNLEYVRDKVDTLDADAERLKINNDMNSSAGLMYTYNRQQNELDVLMGRREGEEITYNSLVASIETTLDIELDDDTRNFISEKFNTLNEIELFSSSKAISAILGEARNDKEEKQYELFEYINNELRPDRAELKATYDNLIAQEVVDLEALSLAATALYYEASYTEEDNLKAARYFTEQIETYGHKDSEIMRLSDWGNYVSDMYDDHLQTVYLNELEKLEQGRLELQNRVDEWNERIGELYNTGLSEWDRGFKRLIGMRKTWQNNFEKDFEDQQEIWNAKHALFVLNREKWVEDSARAGVLTGSTVTANEIGINADKLITEVEGIIIPDLQFNSDSLTNIIDRVVDRKGLLAMIESARFLTNRIDDIKVTVAANLPEINSISDNILAAEDFQNNLMEEIEKHAAFINIMQMKKMVDETRKGIAENVDDANKNMDKNLTDRFVAAGYNKNGSYFRRRAVIDETIFGGLEEETHTIEGYRYFRLPEMELSVDLSIDELEGLSGKIISARARTAQKDLQGYISVIFGQKSISETKSLSDMFKEMVRKSVANFKSSAQYEDNKDTEGMFNMYVGYAPVMDEDAPEKVETAGYGELGRVFEDFMRNEARLGRGLANFDLPMYSLRLWDDDKDNDGKPDSWFHAPTPRGLVKLGVQIVASIFTGPMGAMAIGALTDLAYSFQDIAYGLDPKQVMSSFGKGVGISAISTMVGGAFNGFGEAFNGFKGIAGNVGSVMGKVGMKGLEKFSSNALTGLVSSIGKDGFDGDAYRESMFGRTAIAGYAAGMAGTFVGEGLGAINLRADKIEGLGSHNIGNISSFNNTMGSLASMGVEYGMTGQSSINVLNMSDLTGGRVSGGLLELKFGQNGSHMEVGGGGYNMSLSNIASAFRGIKDLSKNKDIRNFVDDNDFDSGLASVMRGLYAFGDDEGQSTLNNILDGVDRLHLGYTGGTAKTVANDDLGGRDIYLSAFGSDGKSRMESSVWLGHEAYRDGVVTEDNANETAEAVIMHTLMANRIESDKMYGEDYFGGVIGGELDFLRSFENADGAVQALAMYSGLAYDSKQDNWKMNIIDGKMFLEWDGYMDLKLPNGDVIDAKELMSQLAVYGDDGAKSLLGVSGTELKLLFKEAGAVLEDGVWKFGTDYVDLEKAGQEISADDGFSLDMTELFVNGDFNHDQMTAWIEDGAEGMDRYELATASTQLFYKLSKGIVENEMADFTVYGSDGNVDYLETKQSFEEEYGRMVLQLALSKVGNAIVDAGAEFLTGEASDIDVNAQKEFTYKERYNELFASYASYLMGDGQFMDADYNYRVSQNFGSTDFEDASYPEVNGDPFHNGLDIWDSKYESIAGQDIYSGWGGRVITADEVTRQDFSTEEEWQVAQQNSENPLRFHTDGENYWYDKEGNGNFVIIEHMFQFEEEYVSTRVYSTYSHLDSIDVNRNQYLSGMDSLGTIGNTGTSTDDHLHQGFRTLKNYGGGQYSFLTDLFNLYNEPLYPSSSRLFHNPKPIWDFFNR